MDLQKLSEEELCKFCYTLCVNCNWNTNQLWIKVKKYKLHVQFVKDNAKLYMIKFLKLPATEIKVKRDFFIPYKFKRIIDKYQKIIEILIKNNIINDESFNNNDWLESKLSFHINKFCYKLFEKHNWNKEKIEKEAISLSLTYSAILTCAKKHAIETLKFSENDWNEQLKSIKQNSSKYYKIFQKILELNNDELLSYLTSTEADLANLRSYIHNFAINYHPKDYQRVVTDIKNKLNYYNDHKMKKRKKSKEEQRLELSEIIIENFLKKEETIETFCQTHNIKKERFFKHVNLIKEKNSVLYQKYLNKLKEIEFYNYQKSLQLLKEVMTHIKTNLNFTILDYYFITNFDFKKLTKLAEKELNSDDLKIFRVFAFNNKTTNLISKADMNDILSSTLRIKFNTNPDKEIIITKEEKLQVMLFLNENNIPAYPKVYRIAITRYANGELDITKKNTKRKILFK